MNFIPKEIEQYATAHSTAVSPLLQELTEVTYRTMQAPQMLSGQIEGMVLQFLVAGLGAKTVLEIGMFTGFSAQMMAAALPHDGKLITCETNPKAQETAQQFFDRTPVGKKIEIRMGPALETLQELAGPFDLVFIDADKENYIPYYERSLELLSPSGIIAVDNVLWSGRVLSPQEPSDKAIAAFNHHVQNDTRVQNVILTIRDGLMLIRRV